MPNYTNPPTIFFAHANGFPARSYGELLDELAPYPVDFIPVLGAERSRLRSWEVLADELVSAISSRHQEPVVGLGHSIGGVATFWAARKRPDLFSKVIILDPPFFGWQRRVPVALFQALRLAHKVVPPARNALRRRDHFASREEARDYWASKRFFQAFSPQALELYVQHGLVEQAQGLTLRIPREQESAFFAAMPVSIGSTSLPMPSHYVVPQRHGIAPAKQQQEIRRKFRSWHWHEVPGSHMFPLEHPGPTANLVKSLLNI